MEIIIDKWEDILNKLKTDYDISDVSFNTWIKPLEIIKIDEESIHLYADQQMAVSYVNKKYATALCVVIEEITGKIISVKLYGPDNENELKKLTEAEKNLTTYNKKQNNQISDELGLNPKYTFDRFIVGSNNRFAHGASVAVAENPGVLYNPLFLHGGVGLGKTHLMHSIAHHIKEQSPDLKILYVTSETFTNELIEALKNNNGNSIMKFREKYRENDILLIDDIQFIIGKVATQEEFFHTFNTLKDSGKQIVISSDRPPKDMETLEERIRSRFDSGVIADIGAPDYEIRMAILLKKVELDGFNISEEVLDYIAKNIKSNVRELEGALNKLIAYGKLTNCDITLDIAEKELINYIKPEKPKEINIQLIVETVSDHYNIPMQQLLSKTRAANVTKVRMIAMYLATSMTDSSQEAIGSFLGGRDHSTVIHGIRKIEEEIKEDEQLRSQIEIIKKKINI